MTIWGMRISCCIPKTTNTLSEYVILFFHFNNDYANAPKCYVMRTLPVFLIIHVVNVS